MKRIFCLPWPYGILLSFVYMDMISAFAGLGALLGMVLCHHKTAKLKFKLLIPIAILWSVFGIGYGYGWIGA